MTVIIRGAINQGGLGIGGGGGGKKFFTRQFPPFPSSERPSKYLHAGVEHTVSNLAKLHPPPHPNFKTVEPYKLL